MSDREDDIMCCEFVLYYNLLICMIVTHLSAFDLTCAFHDILVEIFLYAF